MRLTVGPLPAAVYWRRRGIVLGVLLIFVLAVSYSCRGASRPEAAGAEPGPAAATTPVGDQDGQSPSPVAVPTSGSPSSSPSPSIDPRLCTDDEIKVTAKPEKTSLARGGELVITILIKNVSGRTCLRDVGFDQQELYVMRGAEKVWSSDDCGAPRGSDLRSMPPDHERSYATLWNGKASSACTKSLKAAPDGPAPAEGEYQLFGRVGTDHSEPVTITLN